MQRLIILRGVVMLSLAIVMVGLTAINIPLSLVPLSLGIVALGLLSMVAWWRLMSGSQPSNYELMLQLSGDIAVFSFIFYFSGGYSNPFIWMLLLPITVAAVALKARYAWLIALLSITSYTLLMFYHVPLSHLHMHMNTHTQPHDH